MSAVEETTYSMDETTVNSLFSPDGLVGTANLDKSSFSATKRVSLPLSTPVNERSPHSFLERGSRQHASSGKKSYPRIMVSGQKSSRATKRASLVRPNEELSNVNAAIDSALKVISDMSRSSRALIPAVSKSSSSRDPEDLLAENLQLKKTIHSLNAQKTQLTGRVRSLEDENIRIERKFENYIIAAGSSGASLNSPNSPSLSIAAQAPQGLNIVSNLKQRLREKNQEVLALKKDIEELQQSAKITKLNELESCLRIYAQENTQLTRELELLRVEKQQLELEKSPKYAEALKVECERQSDEIKVLKGKLCSLESLQNDNKTLKGKLSALEKQQSEALANIARLDEARKDQEASYKRERKLHQRDSELAEALKKSANLELLLAKESQQVSKLNGEVDQLKNSLKEEQKKTHDLRLCEKPGDRSAVSHAQAATLDLEGKVTQYEVEAKKKDRKLAELQAENEALLKAARDHVSQEKGALAKSQKSAALENLKLEKLEQELQLYKNEASLLNERLSQRSTEAANLHGKLLALEAEHLGAQRLRDQIDELQEEKRVLVNNMNDQLERAHLQTREFEQLLEAERGKKGSNLELTEALATVTHLERQLRSQSSEQLEERSKCELINRRCQRLNQKANDTLPPQLDQLLETHKSLDTLSRDFLFNLAHLDKKGREKFLASGVNNFRDTLEVLASDWADRYHYFDQTIQDIRTVANKLAVNFDPSLKQAAKSPQMSKCPSAESIRSGVQNIAGDQVASTQNSSAKVTELCPAAQAASQLPDDVLSGEQKKKRHSSELKDNSKNSKSKSSLNSLLKGHGTASWFSKVFHKGSTASLSNSTAGSVGLFGSTTLVGSKGEGTSTRKKSAPDTFLEDKNLNADAADGSQPEEEDIKDLTAEEFSHRKSPTISPVPNSVINVDSPVSKNQTFEKVDDCSSSVISNVSDISNV